MAELRSRQPLHLHIDPFPYRSSNQISPESSPSSSSHASLESTAASGLLTPICSALCMYDFRSDDPDHLPFYKNEILDVIKQETTGWWAAMRRDGDRIGWIPQAFVKPLSESMAEKLRNTREKLRGYEYDAEQLYISAPTQRNLYEPADSTPPITIRTRRPDAQNNAGTPSPQWYSPDKTSPQDIPQPGAASVPLHSHMYQYSQQFRGHPPPSPSTPMPQPPVHAVYVYNKPTPPTPPAKEDVPHQYRGRAGSLPIRNKRSVIGEDGHAISRLSSLAELNGTRELYNVTSTTNGATGLLDVVVQRSRSQKWKQVMGIDDWPIVVTSATAWYLQPKYSDQLELSPDGHIRWGSLEALVERLTLHVPSRGPSELAEDTLYCRTFLTTFRTFTSANVLFDKLVETFRMDHPENLNNAEFEIWKERLAMTQRRVLTIFTMWLENHRLLEEEPHVAHRLSEFLDLIAPPLASAAKLLNQTIERLTFANPTSVGPTSPRKPRKSRPYKNDLHKQDPIDIAEQLTLLEFKRYTKITPQECIRHATHGTSDSNLSIFCSTHDKLVSWVRSSILDCDILRRRADTIDFWIKVAEKCKNMNNIASMSATINALSSTVITRLQLTWAHVGRKSALDALLRHSEPTGGFSGYRSLNNVEGSCVPFIGMYLTDMVHIHDQFNDEDGRICFLQRQRWYEAISVMLRYQSRPYDIAENESTMNLIWKHLQEDSNRDQSWFWRKSQDIQQKELANADIRKGLEAAGF